MLFSSSSSCKVTVLYLFLSLLLPRVCAFLLFSLFFFGGAEANTTVFLYINSCTLNTIQLLTKNDLCGLVFDLRVFFLFLTVYSQAFSFLLLLLFLLFSASLFCFVFRASLTLTGDETYQDIFQDFTHMASNDPDKLNRYQQYDPQRP